MRQEKPACEEYGHGVCDCEYCDSVELDETNFNNNNTENMTNLESRIEVIKTKKAGLSFGTDIKSIIKKLYATGENDIWESVDGEMLVEMVREQINKKDNVVLYYDEYSTLQHLGTGRVRQGNKFISGDKEITSLLVDDGCWNSANVELDNIYVVTDIDAYIDYQLDKQHKSFDKDIDSLNNKIEKITVKREKNDKRVVDAKRFKAFTPTGQVDTFKLEKYLKAEKLMDKNATIEELVELV